MEQVIWKDVVGYEGYYQVSNMGQVKSLDMYLTCRNGKKRLQKGRIKSSSKNNRGYESVSLYKDGDYQSRLVHRLVAEAFVDNVHCKSQVNHIDGDISNNCASNLEWVTDNENKMHSSLEHGGTQRPKKPVIVTNIHTKCKMLYEGLREAERILHLEHKSALNVLKGKQRQTKGYALCYVEGGDA